MRRPWWMAGALASAMFVVGCARQAKIDEAKLGQLPMEDKQAIFTAQHNVSVAEANQAAAERAREQADRFHGVARSELEAVKQRAKAAEEAMEIGRNTNDPQAIRAAEQRSALAQQEMGAAQAKVEYAKRLLELRKDELELAQARVDAARAQLAYVQADALRRNNISLDADFQEFASARDDAMNKVAERERRVAVMRDQVAALRTSWDQRRQAFNVAQREAGEVPPLRAPDRPPPIEPEPMPEMAPAPEMSPPEAPQGTPPEMRQ